MMMKKGDPDIKLSSLPLVRLDHT